MEITKRSFVLILIFLPVLGCSGQRHTPLPNQPPSPYEGVWETKCVAEQVDSRDSHMRTLEFRGATVFGTKSKFMGQSCGIHLSHSSWSENISLESEKITDHGIERTFASSENGKVYRSGYAVRDGKLYLGRPNYSTGEMEYLWNYPFYRSGN